VAPEVREPDETRPPSDGGPDLLEVLAVAPGGTLFVDLEAGSVRVESHDRSEVWVDAVARGWAAELVWFSLEREGSDVFVQGDVAGWLPRVLGGARVRVRVRVPREYSVDVRTRGGRVRLTELTGRIAAESSGGSIDLRDGRGPALLRTSGGSIRAERVAGDLRAHSSGGPVEAEHVRGDVDARTSGGSIEVRDAGGRVYARTSGGSVRVGFAGTPAGEVHTSGGGIEVEIPAGAGVELDARTGGGRVVVEPPLELAGESGRSEARGAVNGGGAPLRLSTSGGDIQLRSR
jgi:hypothetical protein